MYIIFLENKIALRFKHYISLIFFFLFVNLKGFVWNKDLHHLVIRKSMWVLNFHVVVIYMNTYLISLNWVSPFFPWILTVKRCGNAGAEGG